QETSEIESLLPTVNLHSGKFDDDGSQPHFQLKITLQIGQHTFTFDPNLTPAPQQTNTSGNNLNSSEHTNTDKPVKLPVTIAPSTANNKAASDAGVQWYDVQRAFGPVHFNRIGMMWDSGNDKNTIKFLLDASLTVGGLNLSLDGLYVESPLTEFDPHFGLNGLSVDLKSNTLEVTGGLLRTGDDEYSGQALIRFGNFSISALGCYSNHDNHPSLIIFATLNEPIGGPAWFFVNGISAALGYNRTLIVPGLTEVIHFPLVEEAAGIDGQSDAALSDAGSRLRSLGRYIPPSTGNHFIAAGINFSSFRIIQSSILLVIKAGTRLEIDLLGVSTLSMKSKQGAMLAWVQMGMVGTFIPGEGSVIVQGQLMAGSYILSQNCHLTGGFAFSGWFKGEHNGDFVISVGGYHSHFKKPQHYPTVPRLAFNWNVDKANTTHIKGDAYFALCPHIIMAGGHLSVTYQYENISAWFNIGADMLLGWKPFHYELEAYVNIGGSYTFHCFGTHHITVDVGAKVAIWGPEFGGNAALDLWVCTLEIEFGEKPKVLEPITWPDFKKSFLPEDDKCIVATPKQGMVNKKKNKGTAYLGEFNPKEMVIGIDLSIPVKEFNTGKIKENENKRSAKANKNIGVAPAGVDASKLKSIIDLKIVKVDGNVESYPEVDFEYEAVLKKIPAGLWGTGLKSNMNDKGLLDDVIMGLEIKPAKHTCDKTKSRTISSDLKFVNAGVITWEEEKEIPATTNLTRQQLIEMLELELNY
ncbi:MAG TPA: DUF6603 domain-containing protein, partial [Niastella sp.]|nr:DUF6603 domain-containing protein [Niastella sp.]